MLVDPIRKKLRRHVNKHGKYQQLQTYKDWTIFLDINHERTMVMAYHMQLYKAMIWVKNVVEISPRIETWFINTPCSEDDKAILQEYMHAWKPNHQYPPAQLEKPRVCVNAIRACIATTTVDDCYRPKQLFADYAWKSYIQYDDRARALHEIYVKSSIVTLAELRSITDILQTRRQNPLELNNDEIISVGNGNDIHESTYSSNEVDQ